MKAMMHNQINNLKNKNAGEEFIESEIETMLPLKKGNYIKQAVMPKTIITKDNMVLDIKTVF